MKNVKKNLLKGILFFLTMLTMIWCMASLAGAAVQNPDRKGSFTLTLKEVISEEKENLLPEVQLNLYKVGNIEYNGYVRFILESKFADSGVDFSKLSTADEVQEAADKLAEEIEKGDYTPITAVTNIEGVAKFDNLEQGMYLILQGDPESHVEVSPMLLSIPYMESVEIWQYDVEAFPKVLVHNMPTRLTVTKRVYSLDDDFNLVLMPVEDETYVVGLFLDEEGTIPVNENFRKEIHLVNAASGSVVYENLAEGTYYLYELDEENTLIPIDEAYENKDGETWSCLITDSGGDENHEIDIIQPDYTEHEFFVNNYFYEFPDEYYFEGKLSITKNVYIDGEKAEVNDLFYAGIFQMAEDGTTELLKVLTLKQNATVVTDVPLNLENGIPVETKYEILETDADGVPVDDSFEYEVSGEGIVVVKEAETPVNITITNRKTTPPEETPVIIVSPTSPPYDTEDEGGKVDPVKTGDDTPVAMMLAILVLTFGIITGLGVIIRKRK